MSSSQFIGAVRSSRSVNGLILAETEYPSGLSIEPHPHAEALCCLVLEGALTERWGRKRVDCGTGRMTYLPPHEEHGQEYHAEESRCFLLEFGGEWKERMAKLDVRWPTGPVDMQGTRASWMLSQMYGEFRSDETAAGLAIEGYALTMLGEIARRTARPERGRTPGWLVQAVELLHARVAKPLSMAGIAAEVGVHPTHLARTFRERHGCTMGEFLRRLRVEAARDQLASTSKSISSIAYDAGFSDQAHFTRVFKRMVGETPAAWRAAHAVPSHDLILPDA